MNSMEFNKIAAGVIGALLVFLLLNFFSSEIYGTREFAEHTINKDEEGPVLAYAVAIESSGATEEKAPQVDLLALFQNPDAAAGEKTFRACGACHSADKGVNKVGPSLYDVVGRDVASIADFSYSDAMQAVEGDWTPEHLFHFLENPKAVVPGTKMSFAGLKDPQDRVNVIAYLNQHGDAPVDLTAGIEPLAPPTGEGAGEAAGEGDQGAAAGAGSESGTAATTPAIETVTDVATARPKARPVPRLAARRRAGRRRAGRRRARRRCRSARRSRRPRRPRRRRPVRRPSP